jgi:hypothetical protein
MVQPVRHRSTLVRGAPVAAGLVTGLAAIGGLAAPLSAGVSGLTAEAWTRTYNGQKIRVLDVFLKTTSPADRVLLVYNVSLEMPAPAFHAASDQFPPTALWFCVGIPGLPESMEADTHITLGGDQCTNSNVDLWLTPDAPRLMLTSTNCLATPGGWFLVSPNCAWNSAGPDKRVRLARLAIRDEDWVPGASVSISLTAASESCPTCPVEYTTIADVLTYPENASSTIPMDATGSVDNGCGGWGSGFATGGYAGTGACDGSDPGLPGSGGGGGGGGGGPPPTNPPPAPLGSLAGAESLWKSPGGWITGWQTQGLSISSQACAESLVPPLQAPIGCGDFDGDGDEDLLFRMPGQGGIFLWTMQNGVVTNMSLIALPPGSNWKILGIGDASSDGRDDIIWRNDDGLGQVRIWFMNGPVITANQQIGNSLGYEFLGLGDVSGDGRVDILWRLINQTILVWRLNGPLAPSTSLLGGVGPIATSWTSLGMPDLDGDGNADLLWRNTANGNVNGWLLKNSARVAGGLVAPSVGGTWTVQMFTDLDGDGDEDVVWRNGVTNQVNGWLMQGLVRLQGGPLTPALPGFAPIP